MNEDVQLVLDEARDGMKKALDHLENELLKIRAGKASPAMLDSVVVSYYGSMTPLSQVANVNTLDARTITIQPWEKKMLEEIAKSITNANLGLNPQNNGELILINVPVLTEERRKELVKKARNEAEHAKVGIRNQRKEANDMIKSLQKDGLPEDMVKDAEASIQKLTDQYVTKTEALVDAKEADIMKV
jgi:ribosome recycling factor